MSSNILYNIYLGIILCSIIIGIVRIKILHKSAKLVIILLALSLLSEYFADVFARKQQNNMVVYHFYAPMYLFIVSMYFNESIEYFKKNGIGVIIGITGIITAVLNSSFLQPITTLNSYFLLFMGSVIISMSLYAFYVILENDNIDALTNPHFWISFILLFFWSTTYINWSIYKIIGTKVFQIMPFIGTALLSISALTYLGFGLVFLFYPKSKNSGG